MSDPLNVYLPHCVTVWLFIWLIVYLPVCLTVCLTDCLSDYLPTYLTVWLSDWFSICLSVWLSAWLTIWLSVWLPDWLTICLPVCLTVCLTDYLPACLTVCLNDYLPVWLTICLSAWMSVCLTDYLTVCLSLFHCRKTEWIFINTAEIDKLPCTTTMTYRKSGGLPPLVLICGTRWQGMVSLTPRSFHTWENGLEPTIRWLIGPLCELQNRKTECPFCVSDSKLQSLSLPTVIGFGINSVVQLFVIIEMAQ
jgi:hypothetical protein